MRRREFLASAAGAAAMWPLPVRSQQASNIRIIGVLSPLTKAAASLNVEALRGGLRELGYSEDRNIKLEPSMPTETLTGFPSLPRSW